MKHLPDKLFVYGSLRGGFRNPAYDYLTRCFHLAGEAVTRGLLYDKGDSPVAVPHDGDHFITGELYQLKDLSYFEWAFEQLDDYEGLHVEAGETPLYKREITKVYIDEKPVLAWAYWYNLDVSGMPTLEMGEVIKYLQEKNKPKNN